MGIEIERKFIVPDVSKITWEPARSWRTPQMGMISGCDYKDDLEEMVRVAKEHYTTSIGTRSG